MATTSGTIQAKETRLKRTAEYGLKCLYSDLKSSSSTIYTILKRKTYGYFEKKENLMKYKIILVAAVILFTIMLKELKNMEE